MPGPLERQVVASRYAGPLPPDPEPSGRKGSAGSDRRNLWRAAIKWPMYAVAVMPVLLAAGWRLSQSLPVRSGQVGLFLAAAILLLAWENLANDVFDADTGVDATGKPHSLVNLTGRRDRIARLAHGCLGLGLALMAVVALRSSAEVFLLVSACCGVGYVYQGPPFRWGYRGLGEPLCWLAFGPLATAAALLALAPRAASPTASSIPWGTALVLGAGPALATTLVLFCSHFHQVEEDAAHGKRSPVVRLGTQRAAALVPWFVAASLALQWTPVLLGWWPLTALLGGVGIPPARALIHLLASGHDQPARVMGSKFLALRFQALSGLGLAFGLAIGPWWQGLVGR